MLAVALNRCSVAAISAFVLARLSASPCPRQRGPNLSVANQSLLMQETCFAVLCCRSIKFNRRTSKPIAVQRIYALSHLNFEYLVTSCNFLPDPPSLESVFLMCEERDCLVHQNAQGSRFSESRIQSLRLGWLRRRSPNQLFQKFSF